MTNQEFEDEFDVLYNSIASNQAPGLDSYEKSVFLTKAQDEIVKSYFSPVLNKSQEGIDNSERRQIDFSMIISTKFITDFENSVIDNRANSRRVTLDNEDNIMFIINEFVDVVRDISENKSITTRLTVVPLHYKEYARLMSKPHRRPLKYQAWRLLDSDKPELIVGPADTLNSYTIRYVKRPKAIILKELEDFTIDGSSHAQECELDPILHPEILQRAVELAKADYIGDLNSQLVLGSTSQTNIGAVPQSR